MGKFKKVATKPDFVALEKKLLKWWYKAGIVKKYLQKNKSAKKKFSFLDGPITANNPMGVHHAWGRTYKDLWQRYFNMRGYRQRFQNGFDCQGLWVEVEVEKELGFKSKKDIERYGLARFVNKCKERVRRFAKIQTEQSKRLGYFMDWDNSYYTMSEENNYAIWHFLKVCFQNGWLYRGEDSVPWCPRCATAISQHEILTEDYKEIEHESIYFKLKVQNSKFKIRAQKLNLLIWTTTPWTVPANVAVAVNPKLRYVKIKLKAKSSSEELILAKKRLSIIKEPYEILEEFRGKKLLGLRYEGPFDKLPIVKKAKEEKSETFHTIVDGGDLVRADEGTGLLHVAPGAGEEDYQLAKEKNLSVIAPIGEDAKYVEGLGKFSGQNAKEKPEIIINYLKKNGWLYKTEMLTHRYPVCWRCKTELVWRVVDEWYIAMDKPAKLDISTSKFQIPKKLKTQSPSQQTKLSKTLRERMIEVAKKIKWIPDFGLKRELDWLKNMKDWLISKKRYWGLALPIWECQRCAWFTVIGSKKEFQKKAVSGWEKFKGHTPHRPWVDKVKIRCEKCGSLVSRIPDVGNPWLDAGIVSLSTLPTSWFPADFITESFPGQFKNWFYSLIAMATVLRGKPPFKTVLGFATLLAEDGRPMHKSWGNMIEFNEGADKIGVDVMRWMYLRQNPERNLLFGYKKADETRRKFHLILWNVYKFFVTYANLYQFKQRTIKQLNYKSLNLLDKWILLRLQEVIKITTKSLANYNAWQASEVIEEFVNDLSTWYVRRSRKRKDKKEFLTTLHYVLVTLSKLLAPFTPFMAEEIYKNLTAKESVHLSDWPKIKSKVKSQKSKEIIQEMKIVRKICELGHAARKKAGIKVRQPLNKITIRIDKKPLKRKFIKNKDWGQLIKEELNVKKIDWVEGKEKLAIKLDTKITPELKEEGEARELVRKVQLLRKKKGCRLDEKITIYAPSWPKDLEKYILEKTLANSIKSSKELKIERGRR